MWKRVSKGIVEYQVLSGSPLSRQLARHGHPRNRFHNQVARFHLGIGFGQSAHLLQFGGVDADAQDVVIHQNGAVEHQLAHQLQLGQVLQMLQLEALVAGLVVARGGALALAEITI